MDAFDFSFDLKTNRKLISSRKKKKLSFYMFIYVLLQCSISVFSYKQISVSIFSLSFEPNIIMGIITSLNVLIAVIMVQTHWYYGGIISFSLLGVSFLSVLLSVFVGKHVDSLPGFFILLSGIITNILVMNNLRLIQINSLLNKKFSLTDPLTGLYNRRGATFYINKLIRNDKPFFLLFLDLDNFKSLNDSKGHSSGDFVLKVMAKRWLSIQKPGGIIARNGGDEYLIVIQADSTFDINKYADECVKLAATPVIIKNHDFTFQTSASIGVSRFPKDGNTLDRLMTNADMAMYESKKKGKNTYTLF